MPLEPRRSMRRETVANGTRDEFGAAVVAALALIASKASAILLVQRAVDPSALPSREFAHGLVITL